MTIYTSAVIVGVVFVVLSLSMNPGRAMRTCSWVMSRIPEEWGNFLMMPTVYLLIGLRWVAWAAVIIIAGLAIIGMYY